MAPLFYENSDFKFSLRRAIRQAYNAKMDDMRHDPILMVIPSINGGDLLARMLPTLRFNPADVVVLDQGSTDTTAEICAKEGVELLQLGHPHTYTQACNIGARLARERGKAYVCVSNNDIVFKSDVLGEMLAEMERDPRLGIVAPAQIVIDPNLEDEPISYRVFWNLDKVDFYHDTHAHDMAVERLESDFCELTCALVRLAAIDEIGFLDDEYGFYHEDADFGYRLRHAGYSCAYLPRTQIEHFTGSTFNKEKQARKASYIARNKEHFARKLLGHGVNHRDEDDRLAPRWNAVNANIHPYLLRYGLIDSQAPELLVSQPGADTDDFLYTTHDGPMVPASWKGLGNRYQAIFTSSEWMRNLFQERKGIRTYHVALGIEPDLFHPWGPSNRFFDEPTYFLPISSQQPHSLRAALEVWYEFRRQETTGRLVLLGHGLVDCVGRAPDSAFRLEKFQVLHYGAERIDVYEILAPLTTEEIVRFYRSVDFTLFPSCGDGSILPVLESMACGTPVIHGSRGAVGEFACEGALIFENDLSRFVAGSDSSPFARWQPDPSQFLARLKESLVMPAVERAALAQTGLYRVRNAFTLRHTATDLRSALSELQTRDPARFLESLSRRTAASTQAISLADGSSVGSPSLAKRAGSMAARRLQTVGRLTTQLGSSWENEGLKAALRSTRRELVLFTSNKRQQIGQVGEKLTRIASEKINGSPMLARFKRPPQDRSTLLIGYIDAELGLGQSLRGLAGAMSEAGQQFSILPFTVGVEGRRGRPYMPERYDETSPHAVNVIEVATNELPTVFKHVSRDHFDRSYNILRTYWELSRAPDAWKPQLERIDEIWAPNEFVATSFRQIFDRLITVVPPCVELPNYVQADRERFRLERDRYYFLFSFDYYSFPQRKNPLAVVEAFRMAFPDRETNVGLIVKSTGAVGHFPEIKTKLLGHARYDNRIIIFDENFSRDEMLLLISSADSYVSLHRSEGFGLGMAEAMHMGKTVLGTDYSGNTEFLTKETGYPVPFRLRPLKSDEYVFAENQVWAEPDIEACARLMTHVFHHREEANQKSLVGKEFIRSRYGMENIGRIASTRLSEIYSSNPVKNAKR